MKQKMISTKLLNRIARPLVVVALAVVGVVMLRGAAAAGNASYTLSPGGGSYAIGSQFTVSVTESSGGEPVNFVQSNLAYDTSKLQFVGVDASGSSFSKSVYDNDADVAAGKISIGRFTAGGGQPVSGDGKLVTKVTFKVVAGSGSTGITFASDSSIVSASSNTEIWNGSTTGGSYALTTPSTPNPPATNNPSTPSTPNTPSGSGGSSSNSSSGSNNKASSTPAASGGGAAAATTPTPADQTAPAQETSEALTTVITIKITDQDGHAVAGAKVTLDKTTVLSDATGVASFTGLKAGKYKVKVSSSVGGASQTIAITSNGTGQMQRFDLKVKKRPNFILYVAIAVIIVLALLLLSLGKRWHKKKSDLSHKFVQVHVGGEDVPKPEPANEAIATVITPSSGDDSAAKAEEAEALEAVKPKVDPTDTLEDIEKKLGAKKVPDPQPTNDFTPNLITPTKKPNPKPEDEV